MQFDGQKRGYYSTQWAHYCLYIPSGVNIPKTFTFSASYNPNNYNRVYAYAGSSTPKLWAVENTNGRLTTSTHTISLNGQRKVCVGNEIKSNYGGYFPVARYLKINNYNFKY